MNASYITQHLWPTCYKSRDSFIGIRRLRDILCIRAKCPVYLNKLLVRNQQFWLQ